MATTVGSPTTGFNISAVLTGGAAPAPVTSNVNESLNESLTVGAAAFNVNCVYSAPFTVTNGTPKTWDLTSITDALGNALVFTNVTAIAVKNLSVTSGQDMTLGGAISNSILTAFPVVMAAQPQLSGLALCGIELTVDGTHKILELTVAAGTAVAGQITIFGRQ